MNQHRDVTDEDIGMRAFQIRRAKAVERSVERIRYALKTDWRSLSDHEIEEFEWVLGELWAYVARDKWENLRFGRLTLSDAREIIAKGREMRAHTRPGVEVLHEIDKLVESKGE